MTPKIIAKPARSASKVQTSFLRKAWKKGYREIEESLEKRSEGNRRRFFLRGD